MARTSRRIKVDTDIKPISEFRANAADLIEQVKTTGRPLVLTHRGRSAAVVVDAADYEEMVEEIELLRDVQTAVEQIAAGKGVANRESQRRLRRRFRR
ncbi:MAG TPA: type II toxin-antitoxin system Phd/YefM family antitoxin [Thermoanaerobaculia bacterium]|nr:type II toxin-antitoxin system Phd/YefM family antitoxin [Thermoanaerobaculia bacterium]